jgi:hypothetical protein
LGERILAPACILGATGGGWIFPALVDRTKSMDELIARPAVSPLWDDELP